MNVEGKSNPVFGTHKGDSKPSSGQFNPEDLTVYDRQRYEAVVARLSLDYAEGLAPLLEDARYVRDGSYVRTFKFFDERTEEFWSFDQRMQTFLDKDTGRHFVFYGGYPRRTPFLPASMVAAVASVHVAHERHRKAVGILAALRSFSKSTFYKYRSIFLAGVSGRLPWPAGSPRLPQGETPWETLDALLRGVAAHTVEPDQILDSIHGRTA